MVTLDEFQMPFIAWLFVVIFALWMGILTVVTIKTRKACKADIDALGEDVVALDRDLTTAEKDGANLTTSVVQIMNTVSSLHARVPDQPLVRPAVPPPMGPDTNRIPRADDMQEEPDTSPGRHSALNAATGTKRRRPRAQQR